MRENDYYASLQNALNNHLLKKGLSDQEILIKAAAQETETGERKYPVHSGKESQIEACLGGSCGQAFTDMPGNYRTNAQALTAMPLTSNFEKAVFIAGLNAVMREAGLVDHTVHCTGSSPKGCSIQLTEMIERDYGSPKVALFGMQAAMANALSKKFPLRIFDLDDNNIGKTKFGIQIENGICDMAEVEAWADLFLITGSTLTNGTIVRFLDIQKPCVYFGITAAGVAALYGWKRFCPEST